MNKEKAYNLLLQVRSEYQKYKKDHWDYEKNQIQMEYAEGFYQIFLRGVTARLNWMRA